MFRKVDADRRRGHLPLLRAALVANARREIAALEAGESRAAATRWRSRRSSPARSWSASTTPSAAERAAREFERVYAKDAVPDDVPDVDLAPAGGDRRARVGAQAGRTSSTSTSDGAAARRARAASRSTERASTDPKARLAARQRLPRPRRLEEPPLRADPHRARMIARRQALGALLGAIGTPAPERRGPPAAAPIEPPLDLDPLVDLVPAAGLVWLVDVRPQELLASQPLAAILAAVSARRAARHLRPAPRGRGSTAGGPGGGGGPRAGHPGPRAAPRRSVAGRGCICRSRASRGGARGREGRDPVLGDGGRRTRAGRSLWSGGSGDRARGPGPPAGRRLLRAGPAQALSAGPAGAAPRGRRGSARRRAAFGASPRARSKETGRSGFGGLLGGATAVAAASGSAPHGPDGAQRGGAPRATDGRVGGGRRRPRRRDWPPRSACSPRIHWAD